VPGNVTFLFLPPCRSELPTSSPKCNTRLFPRQSWWRRRL